MEVWSSMELSNSSALVTQYSLLSISVRSFPMCPLAQSMSTYISLPATQHFTPTTPKPL